MAKTSLSGISFPVQTQPQEESFLTSPQETRQWLQSLSGKKVGRTAHDLYKVLHDLNRVALPERTRYEITGLFIQPVRHNIHRLEKHYLNSNFPLNEKDRKIAQLSKTLLLELAISLKILLRDQLAHHSSLMDLALTSQRALFFHLFILRQVALTYHNYPRNFWQETHHIYQASKAAGVDTLEVSNGLCDDSRLTRVEDIYKQILLFSLSDHYRLRQQDILQIFRKLPEWSRGTLLDGKFDGNASDNLFFLDLDSNTPPLHLSLLDASMAGKDGSFLMDTRNLVKRLKTTKKGARLNNLSGQYEIKGLSTRILDHLTFVWSVIPPRNSSRTNLKFELTIAVGLKDIYMLLHKSQLENPDGTPVLPADIANRISTVDGNSGMVVELDSNFWKIDSSEITHIDELIFLEHDSSLPAWTYQDDTAVTPLSYQIINESSGGYCISWKDQGGPAIKVGELLGIRSDSNDHRFSLAVSRWMKYAKGHNLLGIAVLSHSSYPIQARLADSENSLIQHCLLLGEQEGGELPMLATPPLAFRAGQTIKLFNANMQIQAQLVELHEGSSSFNIFSYEELSLSEGQETVEESDA